MKILHRVGYYLGGFSIGLIILAFFLNGKGASCQYDYGLDARVRKDIGRKALRYANQSQQQMAALSLDSANIKTLILKADVNFSESDQRKKPCGTYILESSLDNQDYIMELENCSKYTTLLRVEKEE
jgi:hypothetical protein